ncbi:MAG: DUF3987 domain-containing protein [Chitinophagaceae bacterium]|nr:DUF3987 domain-containing protein [Chitinophagaceae bacterium]
MQIKKPANIYAEDATGTTSNRTEINENGKVSNGTIPPIDETKSIMESEPEDSLNYIPQSVYDNLPLILKDSCNLFNDRRERDIFLLGALSVFSGCFHNLYAYNDVDKKSVGVNLLLFIVAPPASGKGALKFAKRMAADVKNTFEDNNRELGSKNAAKLIIPANISSAGLIQILEKNNGAGIIIESEIDTLANANKQDWGNYSDILRNAFENESVSLYRKTDKEHAEIDNLKVSLAISGTPSQFKTLINSTENGLFSRGYYYIFDNVASKLNCFGRMNNSTGKDLNTAFAEFAKVANDYYVQHLNFQSIYIRFSKEQMIEIETILQAEYNRINSFPDLKASIKRSFVVALKIASILSFLEYCEKGTIADTLKCSKTALNTAIQLMTTSINHGYNAYELLPKKNKSVLSVNQHRLYSELADLFTRAEALKKGDELGLAKRTIDGYLKIFKDRNLIETSVNGVYKKLE